jgi:hypothetical protein
VRDVHCTAMPCSTHCNWVLHAVPCVPHPHPPGSQPHLTPPHCATAQPQPAPRSEASAAPSWYQPAPQQSESRAAYGAFYHPSAAAQARVQVRTGAPLMTGRRLQSVGRLGWSLRLGPDELGFIFRLASKSHA